MVTEIPGPKSQKLHHERRASVTDGLGIALPVFVESADGSGAVWWSVGYTATEGPLADPETDPADVEPLTVSVVGAAAEAFSLPWEVAQRSE